MSVFSDIALDRDGNHREITSNEAFRLVSRWTFAAATTGSVSDEHVVFTVTGDVITITFGLIKTSLASGGAATLQLDTPNNASAVIMGATEVANFTSPKVWVDSTPVEDVGALPSPIILSSGADILLAIKEATITEGVIDFYCLWRPLSEDGSVSATTPA
jgi:hypothetical protein